jgi:predicted adenine nucleotide alpha hydrolase (AANH) superfamily ATPase
MDKLLVDACCGPCSLPLNDQAKDYEIIFYVSDDNVQPYTEYSKRLDSIKTAAFQLNSSVFVDEYRPQEWFDIVRGFEDEPENGRRCVLCYRHRLKRAAEYAAANGIKIMTTTLTTGPSKKAIVINRIGNEMAERHGIKFLELDLKRKGGFLKSVTLSKQLGLYRQTYCGCIYSMIETAKKLDKKEESLMRN